MNSLYFAVALHFHQPIGNFEHIIERAYQFCYRPFFELLFNFSEIKITLHISGCLLDYLDERHPQILELVKKMVLRGQIEMMGGAYDEPILIAIPERDILGQIRMMSEYLKTRFSATAQGMWIPERVWAPHLAQPLYEAGIRYAILDDTHLLRSGISKDNTYGYYLTGERDKKIAVFASDKILRYSIPFELPEKTIDYFKNKAQEKENLLFTYGDDGEKFGEWPGTHKWVYQEKWLENFFVLLLQNKDWLKLIKFQDYLKENKPIGSVRINPGSYEEMMEWSNGAWENFLRKYPEANQMHKKMTDISTKIETLEKKAVKSDLPKIKEAKKELYQGQCNCAYWHGVFGGLYLYHLRSAVFTHLINADKIIGNVLHKDKDDWFSLRQIGLGLKERPDIVLEDKTFSMHIDVNQGGTVKELDYKPLAFNLINTLARREEVYHQKILIQAAQTQEDKVRTIHDDIRAVTPAILEKLVYDKFSRYCLRDYFIQEDLKMEDFLRSSYEVLGDFSQGVHTAKKKNKGIILEHESKVSGISLKLSKQIQIKSEKEIEIFYRIEKKSSGKLEKVVLGIEFNLTMPQLNAERYRYFCEGKDIAGLNAQGSVANAANFGIADVQKEFGLRFSFSKRQKDLWYFPVQTVSQSERAYELNYQCSGIFFRYRPDFTKNKIWDLQISWFVV